MDAKGDEDSFIQEFLLRAEQRRAKLAKFEEPQAPLEAASAPPPPPQPLPSNQPQPQTQLKPAPLGAINKREVSYPSLSPLPEESTISPQIDSDLSNDENMQTSNNDSADLNYSSDLSLGPANDDTDLHRPVHNHLQPQDRSDLFRAEPALCQSSPDTTPAHLLQARPQLSPRKHTLQNHQNYLPELNLPPASNEPLNNQVHHQQHSATSSVKSLQMDSAISHEHREKELTCKVWEAEERKKQLKKAVGVPKHGSDGAHVEAAKLLQLAELEHLNYTNQLAIFKAGSDADRKESSESLGSLHISQIRLKTSHKLRNDLADEGISHYFFCVAICGTDIKATETISTNDIRRQDLKTYLLFKTPISFVDLPPTFVVKFEVYELVMGQSLHKLFSKLTPKKAKITHDSLFRRVGSMKLTLADCQLQSKNLTQWSEKEESKYIENKCWFNIDLKPEQLPFKSGMLHVRFINESGKLDWSRFFVDLSNGLIRLWRCKLDAVDGKKPNQILSLEDLCCETVHKLSPDHLLYRPNSFLIYSLQQTVAGDKDNIFQHILEDSQFKIVQHQLAADTKEERDSWSLMLDKSHRCFREWNGKTKIYTMDELNEIFTST